MNPATTIHPPRRRRAHVPAGGPGVVGGVEYVVLVGRWKEAGHGRGALKGACRTHGIAVARHKVHHRLILVLPERFDSRRPILIEKNVYAHNSDQHESGVNWLKSFFKQ